MTKSAIEQISEWRQDAERYRWLKKQAIEGDWGQHCGWKLRLDIKGAPSLETLDEAVDEMMKAAP